MLVTFIKEWNGRHVGDGVHFDEAEAASLINRGIAMETGAWLMMQSERSKPKIIPKAPEQPKKDKMVRSPVKKKADGMQWRK